LRVDGDEDDAGRHRAVPSGRDGCHLGVVFNDLVGGEQVQDRFRQIVGITTAAIGAAGGNDDDHGAGDARGFLEDELPAGALVPGRIALAAADAAAPGPPDGVSPTAAKAR
jgi:hypothetical protein